MIHHVCVFNLAAGFMGFFWALAGLEIKFQAVSELRTPQIYYKTVAVVFKSKSNHFPGLFDGILRVHFEMTTPDLVKYQIVFVTPMFSMFSDS